MGGQEEEEENVLRKKERGRKDKRKKKLKEGTRRKMRGGEEGGRIGETGKKERKCKKRKIKEDVNIKTRRLIKRNKKMQEEAEKK